MKKDDPGRFFIGVAGGVILGALFDNMGIGLLLGFAFAVGLIGVNRNRSED